MLLEYLLLVSIVILLCVFASRVSLRFSVPMLILFIGLGMLFGSDGIFKIAFTDYGFAEEICSIALLFIIFYGGFSTNFKMAKPILGKAILLSSIGVVFTALFVAGFCYFVLKIDFAESFLLGAVISSTDAASVFSILKTNQLSLKNNTAPLLEVESGSNDPFSYMLTMIAIAFIGGDLSIGSISLLLLTQIGVGLLVGVVVGYLAVKIVTKITYLSSGMDIAYIFGVSCFVFALAQLLQGNGYLAVYVAGIILGNSHLPNKVSLIHFFDAFTSLAQMAIFFTLGLLSFPSSIGAIFPIALVIFIFLSVIARPLTIAFLLKPMRVSVNQIAVISFCGLRGAASIVFAIMALSKGYAFSNDIFHIVFCISLLSVSLQGALLPWFSRKLKMVEDDDSIFKTFNDYVELDLQFIEAIISEENHWCNMTIEELQLSKDIRILAIIRNSQVILAKGDTLLLEGDIAVISGKTFNHHDVLHLHEQVMERGHKWINHTIKELSFGKERVVLVVKKGKSVIPTGDTLIEENDLVVLSQ